MNQAHPQGVNQRGGVIEGVGVAVERLRIHNVPANRPALIADIKRPMPTRARSLM